MARLSLRSMATRVAKAKNRRLASRLSAYTSVNGGPINFPSALFFLLLCSSPLAPLLLPFNYVVSRRRSDRATVYGEKGRRPGWILRINCRTIGQTSLDFSSFITSGPFYPCSPVENTFYSLTHGDGRV